MRTLSDTPTDEVVEPRKAFDEVVRLCRGYQDGLSGLRASLLAAIDAPPGHAEEAVTDALHLARAVDRLYDRARGAAGGLGLAWEEVERAAGRSITIHEALDRAGAYKTRRGLTYIDGSRCTTYDAALLARHWLRDRGDDPDALSGAEAFSLLAQRAETELDERWAIWYNLGQSPQVHRNFAGEWEGLRALSRAGQ
jgi:hypothetical protein